MSNFDPNTPTRGIPLAQTPPAGGWVPSRKVIGAAVSGVASILASWIVTGAFDDVERGMAATLLTSVVAAYFVTNQPQEDA